MQHNPPRPGVDSREKDKIVKTPNSITLEAFCANLVAAFLPVVVEERDAGIRILSVMDGAGENHRRAVEAAIEDVSPEEVAEALGEYLSLVAGAITDDDANACDWVAVALCDAAIARTRRDGWNSAECESVTAWLDRNPCR